MVELYDPLTYNNLMAGLVVHFERRPRKALGDTDDVEGPGIYALYYAGTFSPYASIANSEHPIYVGKAVPPGLRKGDIVDANAPALRRRLREHAKSIDAAGNINLADFACKHMAIEPVWITLAERFLIEQYSPLWNLALDGFGDHNPGKGRRDSQRSWWDTMHPGRPWAEELVHSKTRAQAERKVMDFFGTGQSTP